MFIIGYRVSWVAQENPVVGSSQILPVWRMYSLRVTLLKVFSGKSLRPVTHCQEDLSDIWNEARIVEEGCCQGEF